MHLSCAPSKGLVVDDRNGHRLFNFLYGPPGIVPSHARSGLALRLAVATSTLANKTEEAEKAPAHRGLLSHCSWNPDINI